jgi:ornithine cyclodeaminase/alanine dehydrogenase-like protein (mu-crystallin family)
MKIKVFSADDIRRALSMNEVIEVIKDAFAQLSEKKTQSPVRTSLKVSEQGDMALIMPAFLEKTRALGSKLVTVFPRNGERGLPSTQALVVLVDAEMGAPLAVYEGTYLTRLRTGAATGAATQILARRDARTLALFGAGGQALFQAIGVLAVRRIQEIRIFDPIPERAEGLCEDLKGAIGNRKIKIIVALSPDQTLMGADIIVTATTSNTPVFRGSLLSPGAHINAMGAFKPEMQEVDEETILRSRIFVDSVEACLQEAGDLIIPFNKGLIRREDIQGELGEIVSNRKPGRRNPQEITYFKSVGNAVQDISVAQAIFLKAEDKSLGREIEL